MCRLIIVYNLFCIIICHKTIFFRLIKKCLFILFSNIILLETFISKNEQSSEKNYLCFVSI